ncbi:hypothetical protein DXG03_002311 [Asterophora parasitica]|uniref:Uncharacterized protein n=1 Tax=Asterophora parasitica TaxID=117018 RepID=A0A9P7G5V9_9AGAR|nr:hypothetical protein DXG03_002311 [Asterophora parasitica]
MYGHLHLHASTLYHSFSVFRHGRHFEGVRLSIQWAKNPPSSVWRYERRASPPHRSSRDYHRERDPRDRSRSPRRDSRRDDRDRRRSRSPVPDRERERRRSASPDRRRDPALDRDRGRTPPSLAIEEVPKDALLDRDDRERERSAQTPPYDH